MAELRYNPLLSDWTMVSQNRQHRPAGRAGACPFCLGSDKVPDSYDVYAYDNDYPVLSESPPTPDSVAFGPYRTAPAYGKCEVILYSPDHQATLESLSLAHVERLITLWIHRMEVLKADPKHQYLYIFENRGAEIGATITHPHGQIYAYPYIPLKIQRELTSCREYFEQQGHCLICAMTVEEERFQGRMLYQSELFSSYVPFFTDYPYGAFVIPRRHISSLLDLTSAERRELAGLLQRVTGGLDALYDRPMPYMMVLHQAPVNGTSVDDFYHFHIEFYPSLYSATKLKYLASSESGAWAPANPAAVEVTAPLLREAMLSVGRRER